MMLNVRISLFLYCEKLLYMLISLLLFLFFRGMPLACGECGVGLESGNRWLTGVLDLQYFQDA